MSVIQDFRYQAKALENADFQVITGRLVALLEWMQLQPDIKKIMDALRATGRGKELMSQAGWQTPPKARTNEEIAMVGLEMMEMCKDPKAELFQIAMAIGIQDYDAGNSIAPHSDKAMRDYIEPFLNYVLRHLPPDEPSPPVAQPGQQTIPVAIQESLQQFRSDCPDPRKVCFIMMQFRDTIAHEGIERAVKAGLNKYGFTGLLARDKHYHDDLYPNIQTYMHGCGFGIAVFERIDSDNFNPNVSLEIGYMLGLKKLVLLLKDKTLVALPSDLVGKLYRPFDQLQPEHTIGPQIEQWLEDKGFI